MEDMKKTFNLSEFGERLKSLRSEFNVGQNQLAKDLDISNASVSYWETGKQIPSAEVIFKLSKYFNVSSDYLLGLDD